MRWKNRLLVPVFIALIYLIAAFFMQIVPCQVSPNLPNPTYSWEFCSLNPDQVSPFGIRNTYWGLSSKMADACFISLGVVFFIVFIVILMVPRTKIHTKREETK